MTVTGSVHNYPSIPDCELGSHLGNILESGSYSDVTLAVGDREFKAHKAILAGEVYMKFSIGLSSTILYH